MPSSQVHNDIRESHRAFHEHARRDTSPGSTLAAAKTTPFTVASDEVGAREFLRHRAPFVETHPSSFRDRRSTPS